MSIWNKILLGVIGVASLALFYMAARTVKTHQYWCELAQKFERKIEQVQKENQALLDGTAKPGEQPQLGIGQLHVELDKLLLDRRRAWFKCDPRVKLGRDDGSAEVTIITDQPDPNGIAENTILYAFEEADVQKKGHCGQFKVTKADEKQKLLVLVPTAHLTPRELDRLDVAKRPWELYEIMPRDNHEIFASLSDDEKKAMLPAESLPEYSKDGKPADKDDPKQQVDAHTGKYVRPLRDYQVLFSANRLRRTLLTDQIDAAEFDKKLVESALAEGRKQEEAAQKDLAAAKEELADATRQRDVVADYRKLLEKKVAAVQQAVDRLIETNKAMAGQIAKSQLEAVRRIDERTRAMAHTGAGVQ